MCTIRLVGEKYAALGMRSRTRETREVVEDNNGSSLARETLVSIKSRNCGASPLRKLLGRTNSAD